MLGVANMIYDRFFWGGGKGGSVSVCVLEINMAMNNICYDCLVPEFS